MPRRIESEAFQDITGEEQPADAYFDRVVKYIPADVVGAWVVVTRLLKNAAGISVETVLWVCFAVGVAITAIWTWQQTKTKTKPAPPKQILISTIAFIVWVFALGDPFASLWWYNPVFGSLALIAFTLISGLCVPARPGSSRQVRPDLGNDQPPASGSSASSV